MSLSLGLSEAVKSVDSTAINNKLVAPDKEKISFQPRTESGTVD